MTQMKKAAEKVAEKASTADVEYKDVDDIIGIGERLRTEDEGNLSPTELAQIGQDLGIPAEYVDQARVELARRRALEQETARAQTRRRKKIALIAAAAILSLSAVFGIWSYASLSSLRDLHADVEAKRAQVDNIRSRNEAIERQFADRPDSLEKDAQIIGSQNRLRVEVKRFNEAAARYNRDAMSFPNTLWTGSKELPNRVEMTSAADAVPADSTPADSTPADSTP